MDIEIVESPDQLARFAAEVVCQLVRGKVAAVLGLASGKTMLGLYGELARRVAGGEAHVGRVTAFAVDELHGVAPEHPATNASYFREQLAGRVSLRALHLLDSQAGDPEAECARFRRLIAASGGLDLVVLGVGPNGHLAFNEPGSPFDSVARRVALAATTRETYAPLFGAEGPPEYGLTLGVADLLAARRVLLLAFGRTKAGVVARALERPMTEELPASALQRHPQATVLLDREAASALRGQS